MLKKMYFHVTNGKEVFKVFAVSKTEAEIIAEDYACFHNLAGGFRAISDLDEAECGKLCEIV